MSSKNSIKSFVSLILILSSLFAIAFLQMEERRQGYYLLQLNKELKTKMEARRVLEIQRLQALRPQKIEKEIQARTALNQAHSDQIIHLPSPILNHLSKTSSSSSGSKNFLNKESWESNL